MRLTEAVAFSADLVSYDTNGEMVTASGAVRMSRDGNYLAADQVTWNRSTGEVRAQGNVVVVNPQGDKLVGDSVVLTDTLRDGSIENLLVVLESGGRIAAARGNRGRERHDPSRRDLFALPGGRPDRMPAQSQLVDQRRPGHSRSREQPGALPGRTAPAVRDHPAACCRFSASARAATAAVRAAG